ncbi:hypothetical protein [uncultured Roseobacter sp.]|uniref:hypothetical protein n=1 Tax=uncultured Roseobacter sp. TaxID=114847 RepID=UPI00261641CA|nr:hypothetical protein [uncultured Roseobacter sp.]
MTNTSIYLDAQATEKPRPEALATITHHPMQGFGKRAKTCFAMNWAAIARQHIPGNLSSTKRMSREIWTIPPSCKSHGAGVETDDRLRDRRWRSSVHGLLATAALPGGLTVEPGALARLPSPLESGNLMDARKIVSSNLL